MLPWRLASVAAGNPHALVEAEEDPCLENPHALVDAGARRGAQEALGESFRMPMLLSGMCARLGGAWGANLTAAKNTMAAALADRSQSKV